MDCGIAIKDGCLEALEVVFGELFNRHSSLHERYEQGEIQKEYEEAGEKFAKELIEKGAGRG